MKKGGEMFKVKNKEIEKLIETIPVLLKLKANKLEKAVDDCESIDKVNVKYSEYKKLRKQLNKIYKDYVETVGGLGDFAIGVAETDEHVKYLLKKYEKNVVAYSEIFNRNN